MIGARTTDPETSHEAAESVQDTKVTNQHRVLVVLRLFPHGATDSELIRYYQWLAGRGMVPKQSESGIRTRRKELVVKGRVVDSGEREILPSGRRSIKWKVKDDE